MERPETALLERASSLQAELGELLEALPEGGVSSPETAAAMAAVAAAERTLVSGAASAETWHRYLDLTRRREFLLALPGPEARRRWAETTFGAIRASCYSFATLLAQRVASHPDRVFLQGSHRP